MNFLCLSNKLQEPSPAKMVATDPSFPSSGRDRPEPGQWQEDQRDGGPDVTPIWTVTDTEPLGPERTPAGAVEETIQTHTQAFMSISQSQPFPVLSHHPNVLQMFAHSQIFICPFRLTLL